MTLSSVDVERSAGAAALEAARRAAFERNASISQDLRETQRRSAEVVERARVVREQCRRPATHAEPRGPLTARQVEILALVAAGYSTERIAAQLWLSVATVRNHIARALRALDAHSRLEAVAHARRQGLL